MHIYYLIYNGVAAYKKMRKKDIYIYIYAKKCLSLYIERDINRKNRDIKREFKRELPRKEQIERETE